MDEPMTQFRAIPIEWGLSKNPYHKFLMWVAFKATFNGWGRCDALQVTFTIREAADETGSKPSTVSDWVKRAKADGLLLPTGSFSRETGKGEVYGLGGDMLMTVKTPGQGPDKDRTSPGQVDAANSNGYGASPDKLRTSTGQDPDALMVYTPDTPDTPTTTSPSRARKKAGRDKVPPIPSELVFDLERLCSQWPKHFTNQAGQKVRYRNFTKASDLWEHFCVAWPDDDPAEMLQCGFKHLAGDIEPQDEWSLAPKKQSHFIKAMKNFYGVTEKVWKEYR